MTNKNSLQDMLYIVELVKQMRAFYLVIGLKADSKERVVSIHDAVKFCRDNKLHFACEVSSLTA